MSTNLFGRSYTTVGSGDSDYLIKTKGQVKIQWGSKFIDLIKDGKINSSTSILYSIKDKDNIGTSDGIYVTKDQEVYLKLNNITLPLSGGTTFVSFLAEQETEADQKYTALQNIGFIYKDLESITEKALQNGIIYIESTQKLYIVKDGNITEYTAPMSSNITTKFTITKSDSSTGALIINGEGIENSLAFNSLYLYSELEDAVIETTDTLVIKINNGLAIKINTDGLVSGIPIQAPSITSNNFQVTTAGNQTTLQVDKIIAKQIITNSSQFNSLSNELWSNSTIINPYDTVWVVDDNNVITGKSEDYIIENGTDTTWSSSTSWKIHFLEAILCNSLTQNSKYYSSGWSFYQIQNVYSISANGYWTGLLIKTDITQEVGTLNFSNISGQIFDNDNLIQFHFNNVVVGNKLNLKYGNSTEKIGDTAQCSIDLYNISFGECYYTIKTLTKSNN